MTEIKLDWNAGVVEDRGGLGCRDEKIKFYNDHADDYDLGLLAKDYNGPKLMAELIHECFGSNQSAQLLDIGAGTGIELMELKKYGNYSNITALDASDPMLDILEQRKLCSSRICRLFVKDSGIPADTFDGVLTVGCFAPGHLGLDALEEMCNIVKPGGLILIVSREYHFLGGTEFVDNKYYDKIAELETSGKWKIVRNEVVPNYCDGDNGKRFVFQKC